MRRSHILVFAAMAVAALSPAAPAQTARPKSAARPVAPAASAVDQAEDALAKQDFPAAEKLLLEATTKDARDHRAWFDLGYVYSATERKPEAITAYRKSVELKPDTFESNLNLGVLLAQQNAPDAEKYLR